MAKIKDYPPIIKGDASVEFELIKDESKDKPFLLKMKVGRSGTIEYFFTEQEADEFYESKK